MYKLVVYLNLKTTNFTEKADKILLD